MARDPAAPDGGGALDPAGLRLALGKDAGGLLLLPAAGGDAAPVPVRIAPAFPLSDPHRLLCLRRQSDGAELGVLAELSALDAASRAAALEALARGAPPRILRVLSAREKRGEARVVLWEVETDAGPRSFATEDLRGAALPVAPRGHLLVDQGGARYLVPDVDALDRASRARLLAHL